MVVGDARYPHADHELKMAVDDDYVMIPKSQFDCLRQHCEHCPYFGGQLGVLSDEGAAVTPHGHPSDEPLKKRKTLHDPPSTHLSQLEPQLPSRSSNGSKAKKAKSTPAKGPRKKPEQKSRKDEAADSFIHNAPKATEWRKRQTELGIYTVEQYQQAIRAFTDRPNVIAESKPHQGDGHLEHELVKLAERFALLTKDSLQNAKIRKSFATFQALILLSYCEVLRKRDGPQKTLDGITQHIGGREADRRRLLDSALWINGVIVALVSHGWTIYWATELFFLGVFSKLFIYEVELIPFSDVLFITYLLYIHNSQNSRLILEHFKRDEFIKYEYGDCLGPEYTIPGLIASLLDACNITANKPACRNKDTANGFCTATYSGDTMIAQTGIGSYWRRTKFSASTVGVQIAGDASIACAVRIIIVVVIIIVIVKYH